MGLGSTTWLEALPVVLVAAVLLVVPGALGARITGLRWPTALAVGPLLGTTTIALAGAAAAMAGVSWGALPLAAGVLLLIGACALVGRLLRSRPEAADDGSLWSLLAGTALSAVVVALVVLPVSGRPTRFPQSPDTIFHLGTIQWMLERGDVSTLHAGGFAASGTGGFYPAAFHAVAATVAQLTGSTPVVAASATSLVLAAVVWPLGLMLLARRVLGTGWWPTLAASLAAVAFSGFPFWMEGYGVLWPNLYGQALLPGVLALLVVVVDGPVRARSALVVIGALPGLAAAHPSALIAFFLLGTLVGVAGLVRGAWRLRRKDTRAAVGLVGAALAVLLMAGVSWVAATRVSTAMRASNGPGPEMSVHDGLIDAAFFAPRDLLPVWGVGLTVAVGGLVLLVRRSQLWLVLAHGGVLALYLAITLVDTPHTRWFTWPWYNNSPRLGALMVLTGAVLAAAALTGVTELVVAVIRHRRPRTHPAPAIAALVAIAFVAGTAGLGMHSHRQALRPFFVTSGRGAWVSESNLDALRTLGAQVPAGDVVAANPWRGGTYLYLTSDRSLLFPTEKSWTEGDRELLGLDLDRAAEDPAVCAAARRLGVSHVLVGGASKTGSAFQKRRYAGIDDVPKAAGFTEVGKAGDYTLYRLDACR